MMVWFCLTLCAVGYIGALAYPGSGLSDLANFWGALWGILALYFWINDRPLRSLQRISETLRNKKLD